VKKKEMRIKKMMGITKKEMGIKNQMRYNRQL
jgi:hypothetical protein